MALRGGVEPPVRNKLMSAGTVARRATGQMTATNASTASADIALEEAEEAARLHAAIKEEAEAAPETAKDMTDAPENSVKAAASSAIKRATLSVIVPKLEAEVAQWDAAMMAIATGIITEDRPRAADPQATVAVTVVVG